MQTTATVPTCAPGLACLLGLLAVPAGAVQVAGGPYVLHSNVAGQWGGHTFTYALQGERYVFWTATLNQWEQGPEDEAYPHYARKNYATHLIGQFPIAGTGGTPAVHALKIEGEMTSGGGEPQLFRTPDGYLHMVVAAYHYTENPKWGYSALRYYRSGRPEDVTEWVDRTELIPTEPYGQFHARLNVAVTPDGQKAVIAILAVSEDGRIPFNTPVIFHGDREGPDFRFAPAVKYHEPMGFFYPQIATLEDDIVIVGEVWDDADHATSRLVHLDWDASILHEEELPADAAEGSYCCYDMRPAAAGDWNRLVLYHGMQPKGGPWRHQFLTYDVSARELTRRCEVGVEYGFSNAGKWIYISEGRSAFINNPSMGRICAWEGDILGGHQVECEPVPGMDPLSIGYLCSCYIMVPNPLQGSAERPGEVYVMSDVYNPGKLPDDRGPCSLLLWRLALDE